MLVLDALAPGPRPRRVGIKASHKPNAQHNQHRNRTRAQDQVSSQDEYNERLETIYTPEVEMMEMSVVGVLCSLVASETFIPTLRGRGRGRGTIKIPGQVLKRRTGKALRTIE